MPFDPNDHLENLERDSRKPPRMYLPVRWRLVWLREVAPEAVIMTTLLERTDTFALFRATVTLPDGGASATGHGSETKADFGDFIEKAETKSIGRALAALGYGTQFASDLDEGQRIVDSPITRLIPREEPDPELKQAQAQLVAAMQREKWSLARVIETAAFVWPHITSKEDLGTLTAVQLSRLAEVVTGESVINLDVHGVKRIMPAAVAIGMA